jgi:glycosyltransferase involved in cell wall biosynthesis
MKIGIDISQTAYKGTGVARFTRGLIDAIITYGGGHEWVFFYSSLRSPINNDLKRLIQKNNQSLITVPIPPTVLQFLWNTVHSIPIELFTGKLDWLITSDWTEPPSKAKKATIIHDLTVFQHPQTVHPHILSTQKQRLAWVSKESSLIITDSKTTTSDVKHYFPELRAHVETIYPGVTITKSSDEVLTRVKKTYNLTKPFVLSVGKLEPRKNIKGLIEAFNAANDGSYELIIIGPKGWDQSYASYDLKHTRIIGFVTDDELHAFYELCSFFAYPSFWEGFGFPVVEAMLHHKAVVTSNTSSLAEVGAKGAHLCDPHSVQDITSALRTLMSDTSKRNVLAEEGYIHAQQFSWKRYYEKLMDALKSI